MAPKKADKSAQAQKAKKIEDKTFGLKNKNKSSKVQQYVQNLQQSANQANQAKAARAAAAAGGALPANAKDKKKAEEERQKELAALFAVAIKQPKVPAGVDPKSIVCEFYRHGQCQKGFKCKFSHDLSVERKGAKIDLFTDQRTVGGEGPEGENMDDWDQETLEKVIKEKHGAEKKSNETTIICKYFLDAVEKKQYGWFWKCPNGVECKYKHALPPGYVLKSQMKELLEEEAKNKRDVTEVIEEERAKVDAKTPINEEVFQQWRKQKIAEKQRQRAEADDERKKKGILTGREIFMQEGFVYEDDASAADDYVREDSAAEEEAIRAMMEKARADLQRAREQPQEVAEAVAEAEAQPTVSQDASAAGAGPSAAASGAGPSTTLQLDEHDEELFMDDDDDDDDLDDEELDELGAHIKATHVGENDSNKDGTGS